MEGSGPDHVESGGWFGAPDVERSESGEAYLIVVGAHLRLYVDDESQHYGREGTGLPVYQWNP